jgi:hypothetical protein
MVRQRLFALLASVWSRLTRVIGPLAASLLLLALGGLTLLARGGAPQAPSSRTSAASATDTLPIATPTTTLATRPTFAPTATPFPTPTNGLYTGPSYLKVEYNGSSCANGMVSPYPVLNVYNTSPNAPLFWHLTVSNTAYTLWNNPPNPIQPGWSDYFEFRGPANPTTSLSVTINGDTGTWADVLKPCAVATPTWAPPPITITCAFIDAWTNHGRICVQTLNPATVSATVVYCDGQHDPDYSLGVSATDSQGVRIFDWIARPTCYGPATVTVSVKVTYIPAPGSTTFTITVAPPPTPTPIPTFTLTATLLPTAMSTP